MKKKATKTIIIINCILACVMLTIAGSLAAYTSLSNAKRVVSTVGSKQLFSSNMLMPYESGKDEDIQKKSVSFSSDSKENTFVVSVCNYSQSDKTKWATEDTPYSMTVDLYDLKGNKVTDTDILSKYKWAKQQNSSMSPVTFAELSPSVKSTLPGGALSEDLYTVTVPADYMKDYRIKITADSGKNGYSPLGRIISVAEDVAQSKWKISFLGEEKKQEAYDLGCINTVLSGSEHAMLTLKWDPEHIEIDPWFIKDMGVTVSTDTDKWNYIEFKAGEVDTDGNPGTNQYNIIFYRTKGVHSDDTPTETWDAIQNYIKLESYTISE